MRVGTTGEMVWVELLSAVAYDLSSMLGDVAVLLVIASDLE
jgi:hypothetical protein